MVVHRRESLPDAQAPTSHRVCLCRPCPQPKLARLPAERPRLVFVRMHANGRYVKFEEEQQLKDGLGPLPHGVAGRLGRRWVGEAPFRGRGTALLARPGAAGRASPGQRRQAFGGPGSARPESRKPASRSATKKFCHRLYPWAPPVAELSPSRSRFRPPIPLTFAFRLRPSRSASTYSRPVLDAGRTLRASWPGHKGGQGRKKAKLSLFANFSFFHISTAIVATCG
jgi:hypothetical protein